MTPLPRSSVPRSAIAGLDHDERGHHRAGHRDRRRRLRLQLRDRRFRSLVGDGVDLTGAEVVSIGYADAGNHESGGEGEDGKQREGDADSTRPAR